MLKGSKFPALIQAISFYRDPYKFLRRAHKKYGDIFIIKLPGFSPCVVVSDANCVKQIFTANAEILKAGEANAFCFSEIFGQHSLLILDGSVHLRDRKLILPALHGEILKNYQEKITVITQNVISTWQPNDRFASSLVFPMF